MYKVVKLFTDLQDNNFVYSVGDEFPRAGLEVSEARLAELAGTGNKRGVVLIEKVEEPEEKVEDVEPEVVELVAVDKPPKRAKKKEK